jgi:hypothetical protein
VEAVSSRDQAAGRKRPRGRATPVLSPQEARERRGQNLPVACGGPAVTSRLRVGGDQSRNASERAHPRGRQTLAARARLDAPRAHLRTAPVGHSYLRARRPGRRRSLRRGAAVLSCRRGENTANSGPGHSRGVRTDLCVSFSLGLGTGARSSGRGPPAAFRLTSDGRHRARRGRARPEPVAFVAQRRFAALSDRWSVSRFRDNATATHSVGASKRGRRQSIAGGREYRLGLRADAIDTGQGIPDESVEPMRAPAGPPDVGTVSVFRADWAEKRAWKAGDVSTFASGAAQSGLRFNVSGRGCAGRAPFQCFAAMWLRPLAFGLRFSGLLRRGRVVPRACCGRQASICTPRHPP